MSMLTSLLGIRLILWVGDTVPTPASPAALRALTQVEVRNDANGANGFKLTFTLGKDRTGDYGILSSGEFDPDKRVVIGVVLGVTPEPLIDGIIHHHQVTPSNQPGLSTLTVMGRDISVMLDLEEKDENHNNQPDFLIVNKILARYAQYIMPPYLVTPTTDVPIELQRIPHQSETDLRFLQRMAQRNGYVFYIEPLLPGVNSAYWGPENRAGLPLPALSMNLGDLTNVKTLQFSNNALAATGAQGSFVEPITKTSIRIPPLPSLRVPPLAATPVAARRTARLRDTARQNPAQAALSAVSTVSNTAEPVTGNGEVDTVRYGTILRARRLVGVRGAGMNYNGNYYLRQVTHTIQMVPGSYTQRFTLSREGVGTLLPVVRP
jgi:hypothetical protein